MGMFNWVDFEWTCRGCGSNITGFQTKSSRQALFCDTVKPWDCHSFYAMCDDCDVWYHFDASEDNPWVFHLRDHGGQVSFKGKAPEAGLQAQVDQLLARVKYLEDEMMDCRICRWVLKNEQEDSDHRSGD